LLDKPSARCLGFLFLGSVLGPVVFGVERTVSAAVGVAGDVERVRKVRL